MFTISQVISFIRRISIPSEERGDIRVTFVANLPGTSFMVNVATVRIQLCESEDGTLFYSSELRPYAEEIVSDIENGCYFVDDTSDVLRTDDRGSEYTVYVTRH